MRMLKNFLAFLLLSNLHLARLDVPGRTIVGRHYTSQYRLNTIKEWKGLDEEAISMKKCKSNQPGSEAEFGDLLSEEEENRGKKQQILHQSAAAYSDLQSELPRARRSPGLNATEVGKSRPNLNYIIDARNAEGFTPLYLAVTNDHTDIAASFLQAGADLQQTFFAEHRNLLHEASRKGAVNSIRWLVKAGLSINATDDNKWTALHYAASSGQLNATKTLIELKCCIDCKSSEGYPTLRNAVVNSNTAIADLLIESGADVQQKLYNNHSNLLHEASRFDAVNSIYWLVEKNLSINATDDNKWTPLHYAAYFGRMIATQTLIHLKCCIDCISSEGYTALRNALVNDFITIAARLIESGADVQQTMYDNHINMLHEASRFGAVNSIHWLVKKGFSVNATDNDRWSPLHYAAYYGRVNATKALIDLKSCIHCKSSKGLTALRNAVRKDHTDIAHLLVEFGADVQETFIDAHKNLLHEASGEGAVNAIYWLVNKGLNVNATDDIRWTPLHYAAYYGRLYATKTLIQLKCCIDCRCSKGYTALRNALKNDHTDVAALLVGYGADVQQTSINGHNLLHEASAAGAVNSIHWLVKKGLDVNATDNSRWTPLHFAPYNGKPNVARALIQLKCCIDCKTSQGLTALLIALAYDHTTIAALLVESGADLLQTFYDDHRNLLHEASIFGAVNSIHWLVKNGFSVNATDDKKFTPLHYAAYYGKMNATKTLIDLKSCINCRAAHDKSPLDIAEMKHHQDIAAFLKLNGATSN